MENNDFEIKKNKEGFYSIKLHKDIYPINIISTAAYAYLDKAYIFITKSKKDENVIFVNVKPKIEHLNAQNIALQFGELLLTYLEYNNNFQNNKDVRNMILQRAIITNEPELVEDIVENRIEEEIKINEKEIEDLFEEENIEDSEDIEDIEDIAIPWEEKYGKNIKKNE